MTPRIALVVLLLGLLGCATTSRHLPVDRTPAGDALFPVVPFDMLYVYGTEHVIAFLEDHPVLDAVEITMIDGGMPLFIKTWKDLSQTDYMNSRAVVETRATADSTGRRCEYAEIEYRSKMREDGVVESYARARFEDGQVIEQGTHDQLVSDGGSYASMWELQVGAPA